MSKVMKNEEYTLSCDVSRLFKYILCYMHNFHIVHVIHVIIVNQQKKVCPKMGEVIISRIRKLHTWAIGD